MSCSFTQCAFISVCEGRDCTHVSFLLSLLLPLYSRTAILRSCDPWKYCYCISVISVHVGTLALFLTFTLAFLGEKHEKVSCWFS